MAARTGGQALVEALVAHGVETVFGIPGTHNLAVYSALAEQGVAHVLPRHEQGAGYAADGYARSTGRVGVALTTTGPAILNAAAAAAQAYSDSVPVLFISPGMPLQHPAHGNGLLHEIVDQGAAMAAVLGTSLRVTSVAEIPLAVQQAFAIMTTGRPRPVHLEVPLDLLDEVGDASPVPPVVSGRMHPDPVVLEHAVTRLDAAESVAIVVGGGAFAARAELVTVAELLGAGVVTTANGKGCMPAAHPLFVGAGLQHAAVRELCEAVDVVLAVGTEFAPSDWWSGLPQLTAKVVRIDVDASAISTNVVPDVAIVADARTALAALTDRLRQKATSALVETARAAHRAQARQEGAAWIELIDALAQVLPDDTIIAADNAMAAYYGALSNLPLSRPHAFLYPTGAGTLGYGLPAGIGAKVGDPSAPVLVLHGDGGLMFSVAELATAAELGLALPIVVVDNGGYGEIRNEMDDRDEPIHAVALGSPDFVMLAHSLGCLGVRAQSSAEVASAVEKALHADRPTVIHVRERSRATGEAR